MRPGGGSRAPPAEWERQLLDDQLGPPWGRTVLDVGCGTGELARWCHARGFEVTGVDMSSTAVKAAGGLGGGPRYSVWDADRNGPEVLPHARFDVITCRLTWVFLRDAGGARLRSLPAPGGTPAVVTPVRERLGSRRNTGMPEAEITALVGEFGAAARRDVGPLVALALRDTPAEPGAGRRPLGEQQRPAVGEAAAGRVGGGRRVGW